MRCSCGKEMKEEHRELLGVKIKMSVCPACGKELIDMNNAIKAQKRLLPKNSHSDRMYLRIKRS